MLKVRKEEIQNFQKLICASLHKWLQKYKREGGRERGEGEGVEEKERESEKWKLLLDGCLSCSSLQGFSGPWFVYLLRYVILFSYIIPIRLNEVASALFAT